LIARWIRAVIWVSVDAGLGQQQAQQRREDACTWYSQSDAALRSHPIAPAQSAQICELITSFRAVIGPMLILKTGRLL
jgi:hypothetical protein